jgi:hypothetical protein
MKSVMQEMKLPAQLAIRGRLHRLVVDAGILSIAKEIAKHVVL